jgi:hypothetical protein
MPVAASSSAVVSARPTRPGTMPRSATALRIQDSAEAAGSPRAPRHAGGEAKGPAPPAPGAEDRRAVRASSPLREALTYAG